MENRRRESAKRSAKYNRGDVGKRKKKVHNARRSQGKDQGAEEEACSQDDTPPSAVSASVPEQAPESTDSAVTAAPSPEDAGVRHKAEELEVNETLAKLGEGTGQEEVAPRPVEAEETADSEPPHKHAAEESEAEKGPAAGEQRADSAAVGQSDESSDTAEGGEFAEGIIEHVRLLAGLIDGEDLSRQETIELLRGVMRQHSIAKESALDYVVGRLRNKPP